MTSLWQRYRVCQDYGIFSGHSIPNNYLHDTALIVINRSGQYCQAYLDFKREVVQTYNNVKTFFNAREADLDKINDEAGKHGYGRHAAEGDALNNEAATRAFTKLLTDMAAAVQTREAAQMASGQSTKSNDNMAMMMQGMQAMQQQLAMLTAQRSPITQQPMYQQQPQPTYQQPQNHETNNRNNRGSNTNCGERDGCPRSSTL